MYLIKALVSIIPSKIYMASTHLAILGSHQARIRCTLKQLFPRESEPDVERFENGAVIKLILHPSHAEVTLLSSQGGGGPSKVLYNVESFGERFPFKASGMTNMSELPSINEGEVVVIYIVRHGQADHNIITGLGGLKKDFQSFVGKKDTTLTQEGINQAQDAGRLIGRDVGANYPNLAPRIRLFSSDLVRTIQTVFHAAVTANLGLLNKSITVVPCAHEIQSELGKGTTDCDGGGIFMGSVAQENTQTCGPFEIEAKCSAVLNTLQQKGYVISWNAYCDFYGGMTRNGVWCGRSSTTSSTKRCRDTSMLKQVVMLVTGVRPRRSGGRNTRMKSRLRRRRVMSKRKKKRVRRTRKKIRR